MISASSDALSAVDNLIKASNRDAESLLKPLQNLLKHERDVPTLGSYLPFFQNFLLEDKCPSSNKIEDLLEKNLKLFKRIIEIAELQTGSWLDLLSSANQHTCYEKFVNSEFKILSALRKWEMLQKTKGRTEREIVEKLFLEECANSACETALSALLSAVDGSGLYGCDFLRLMHVSDDSWNRTRITSGGGYLTSLINMGLNVLSFYYARTTSTYDAYEMVVRLYGQSYNGALERFESYLEKPSLTSVAILPLKQANDTFDCLAKKFATLFVDFGAKTHNAILKRNISSSLTNIILDVPTFDDKTGINISLPDSFKGRVWLRWESKSVQDLWHFYQALKKSFEQRRIFPSFGILGAELRPQPGKYSELNELPFWSGDLVDLSSINPPIGFCSEWITVCGQSIRKCQDIRSY
jgi:hypothetical protein